MRMKGLAWVALGACASYLMVLGIGFFWAAIIDAVHMPAYKGMGVFPGGSAHLPTELWILARYLQATTILVASVFLISLAILGSELAFTTYVSVYGIAITIGHLFKLAAYTSILVAVLRTMLSRSSGSSGRRSSQKSGESPPPTWTRPAFSSPAGREGTSVALLSMDTILAMGLPLSVTRISLPAWTLGRHPEREAFN